MVEPGVAPAVGFATPIPGCFGSPSAPTTWGRLEWLDEDRLNGGESPRDQGTPRRPRKIRSRSDKSHDGALRGGHSRKTECGALRGVN